MARLRGLFASLGKAVAVAGRSIVWLLTTLLGHWQWHAPSWLNWLGARGLALWRAARSNPRRSVVVLALLTATMTGGYHAYRWYQNRPKPIETLYSVVAPGLSSWDETKNRFNVQPLVVEFEDSVAPLEAIGKPVAAGVSLSPVIVGRWTWESERRLVFQPNVDWPIGAEFNISFDKKKLLAPHIVLADYSSKFKTAPFEAMIASNQFYQDPQDPQLRKLVATVRFSHAVDSADFEKHIKLQLSKDAGYLGMNADATEFSVTYDKQRLYAYIHSHTLTLPREDVRLNLLLEKGIRSARGGGGTAAELNSAIVVPGRFSLRFDHSDMTLVDNERFEPEQVLMLGSSAPLNDRALDGKVKVLLLPEQRTAGEVRKKDFYSWSASQIGKDVIERSEPLSVVHVPGEDSAQSLHAFKLSSPVPVGRSLYVEVDAGVQAVGGTSSAKAFSFVQQVPPYPRSLKLMSDGAVLSLSGARKVSFMARGIEGVRIEIGRLLPNQLHQLVDANWNSFSHPELDQTFSDRLVERFVERRPLVADNPGKPVYDNIDLGAYLREKAASQVGVFMVRLSEYTPGTNNDRDDDYGSYRYGASDSRLVLLTDLGILVKRAVDGSQDVFVQSIRTGQPVAGARVDLTGRNGIALESQVTDATGRVHFNPVERARREKTPLMFVVEKDGDVSFLPLARNDRVLNLSRFDVGGIQSSPNPDSLTAFLFSDRGIYRPGEAVHIGAIVRTQSWQAQLDGMPVDAEVTDPRGMVLLRKSLKLHRSGFEEFNWSTATSSPTGHYNVSLYLVKDNQRGPLLGSTTVRVQEFEPDRMKVSARLSETPAVGWLSPAEVQARVRVMHLFGTPAANRRVQGEIKLTPALPAFARYPDYVFFDRGKLKEEFQDKLSDTSSDDNGDAAFDLNLQRFDRATYRLSLLARAFEPEGGRNVAAFSAALVSSAPYLVGVKAEEKLGYLQRESRHVSRWLAIDAKLNPLEVGDLNLEWVQRKFISVLIRQNDGTYRYQSRRKDTVRETKPFKLAAAGSEIALPSAEPGDFVLVLRDKTGAELNRLEYSVVGDANLTRSLERNAELQLKLDKSDYQPGDTIEVSIQAPFTGAGLITIERDRVYQHVWFKADTTGSVQKITLPRDFEGNGYVSVQFVRDPASDEIFMSPLSYGVVPFAVALERRIEAVRVESPALVKPGADLAMRISTAQPARVALFAVDEGILQVAGYKKPDPLGYFFQKRALNVSTSQILDLILPEFQHLLQSAAPGGDDEAALARNVNPFQRKRRAPAVYWSGIVDVDASGKTLHYRVPDYFNGKLRIFAVAVTPQTIGVFDGGSEVRGDLILSPNLPAMVAPGDEFSVSVSVLNNAQESTGPVALQLKSSPGLQVVGAPEARLDVAPGKEGVARFTLRATETLGSAALDFSARVGHPQGDRQGRISDSVSVRPALPFRTQLTAGRGDKQTQTLPLTRDLYREHRRVEVVAGYSPLAWSSGLTAYLRDYPYSCTEQLVSQGMPALLFGSRPELGKVEAKSSLTELFQTLRSRQNDQGAFGLWASTVEVDTWPSIYATHFLVEARERGQDVPSDMLVQANYWLNEIARPHGDGLEAMRQRAYAIYLLTRQGVMTSGLIGTLQQELDVRYPQQWPIDITAAYLAASYRLLQKNDLAERIIKRLPWSSSVTLEVGDVYYDGLGHDAQLLYLLARHFPARLESVPASVLDRFGRQMSESRYNSLTAAYLLLALEAYAGEADKQNGALTVSELDKNGKAKKLPLPAGLIPRVAIGLGAARVELGKDGDLPLFYNLTESGFDRKAPDKTVRQGLEIQREYLDLKGNPLPAADGGALRVVVGDEFLVRLRLRAIDRDRVSSVAVVDLLPGGIEPVLNRAVATTAQSGEDGETVSEEAVAPSLPVGDANASTWRANFAEVRDDRLVLYGSLGRDVATFVYRVRATNAGLFQSPAPYVESMYQREYYANAPAGKLEIVKPQ